MKKFLKLLKDVSGASAAEYALILAIVGAAIALAAVNLGNAVKGSLNNAANTINSSGSSASPSPAPAPAPAPAP